jgi:endonuclease/exonuclease/phosphatase family metal-dependent hydrolase
MDTDEILRDFEEAKGVWQADVWMLQEVAQPTDRVKSGMEELARRLDMYFLYTPVDPIDDGKRVSGLAILSRYRFAEPEILPLKQFDLKFHTRCRVALGATVNAPSGPVRVVNIHLDTRINKEQRLEQIAPAIESASGYPFPKLIAGDFNTANFGWIANVWPVPFIQNQAKAVRQFFERARFETPFVSGQATFKGSPIPLTLDWIFLKGLKTVSSGVEEIDFSDHHALWVHLVHDSAEK